MENQQNLVLSDMLIEVVNNQLNDGNPIKVKETLMRLRMTGIEQGEAIEYIACALGEEMTQVIEQGSPFDEARYGRMLDMLPEMPWAKS